uniref:Uncharacterized protein n=1 Tax=Anguilla anguilla TaxID=7936 RepID=A0A0E9Y2H6_ANGAN
MGLARVRHSLNTLGLPPRVLQPSRA